MQKAYINLTEPIATKAAKIYPKTSDLNYAVKVNNPTHYLSCATTNATNKEEKATPANKKSTDNPNNHYSNLLLFIMEITALVHVNKNTTGVNNSMDKIYTKRRNTTPKMNPEI